MGDYKIKSALNFETVFFPPGRVVLKVNNQLLTVKEYPGQSQPDLGSMQNSEL